MKVLLILFACVLVVSAQWSSEQRERELERERERELKKWDDKKWDEKRWDKKSWKKWTGCNKSMPKIVTTTSIYMDEWDWESNNSRHNTCTKMWYELRDMINHSEWTLVKSSWEMLKKDSDFAPKIFLRYFKAFPESLSWFPTFSNVSFADLPTNGDFLLHAYSSTNWWNMIWYSIENPEWTNSCPEDWPMMPEFNRRWMTNMDWKKFTTVWMTTVQEELGSHWTPEVKTSWENTMRAFGTWLGWTKIY